jgi:hypothetical protein
VPHNSFKKQEGVDMRLPGSDIPKKVAKKGALKDPVPGSTVSQETRDRLYAEAREHPAFAGMGVADLRASLDYRLDAFLIDKPWWYGYTGGPEGADIRHHASRQQYRARREKEESPRKGPVKVPVEEALDIHVPQTVPVTSVAKREGKPVRRRSQDLASLLAA